MPNTQPKPKMPSGHSRAARSRFRRHRQVHSTGLPEQPVSSQPQQNLYFNTRYGSPWVPTRGMADIAFPNLQSQISGLRTRIVPKVTSPGSSKPVSVGIPFNVLTVSAAQSPIAVQNKTVSEITVTFTRYSNDPNFDHVNIWVKGYNGNPNWIEYANATNSPANFTLESNGETINIAVQAASAANQVSAPPQSCPIVSATLSGVVTNPPAPTVTQNLTATPLGYQFTFDQIVLLAGTEDVMKCYKVYRNSSNSFSGATVIQTIPDDGKNDGAPITVQGRTGGGHTYYYWVTSVNTIGLESTATAAQASALTAGLVDSRSTSPLNVQGITTSAGAILTQSGTSKTIDVAAFTVQYGTNIGQISYNSGSVTPASYGQYTVYFSDPDYAGGTVTFMATATAYLGAAADGDVIIGSLTTSVSGGGSGGGGGGGGEICFSPDTKVRSRRKFWFLHWQPAIDGLID